MTYQYVVAALSNDLARVIANRIAMQTQTDPLGAARAHRAYASAMSESDRQTFSGYIAEAVIEIEAVMRHSYTVSDQTVNGSCAKIVQEFEWKLGPDPAVWREIWEQEASKGSEGDDRLFEETNENAYREGRLQR